jgi:hypothetical protein
MMTRPHHHTCTPGRPGACARAHLRWSGRRATTPRHQAWKACVLPTELHPHCLTSRFLGAQGKRPGSIGYRASCELGSRVQLRHSFSRVQLSIKSTKPLRVIAGRIDGLMLRQELVTGHQAGGRDCARAGQLVRLRKGGAVHDEASVVDLSEGLGGLRLNVERIVNTLHIGVKRRSEDFSQQASTMIVNSLHIDCRGNQHLHHPTPERPVALSAVR